jgi:Family of unknown function (DUF6049)
MRSVRTVVRTLIAGFLALAGPLLAAPAAAYAQEAHQQSSGTDSGSPHQLTVSIDALNHSFATPTSTITVSGTLTNDTGKPMQGIQMQVLSAQQLFYTRQDMDSYAAGNGVSYIFLQPVFGASYLVPGTLHSGATVRWSASFTAAAANYSEFGVYPLAAQAEYSDGTPVGSADRTFLPYWPGNGSAKPLSTAWIWPLVDQPQRDPCEQTLATNSLAQSLSTEGRLGTLLTTGQQWARRDHLTWAVDPALLSDAEVMTHNYAVGGNATCTGSPHKPASKAAASWLTQLRTGTSGDPMFLTPYGDVDVSALSHTGLDQDLQNAYRLGESVARKILSRPFGIKGTSTGDGGSPAVAWPAGGVADASVLSSLATDGGIDTVVLNSDEMPSTDAPYDNALGAATTLSGGKMPVLLADSELSSVLGSAPAGSSASAQFSAEQDFLAQTAMISAEVPNYKTTRTLVLAPPRRWDPTAAEAVKLLSLTRSAPWLRQVPLSTLASAASKLTAHKSLPSYRVGSAELTSDYLNQVRSVDSNLAVYEDLLYQPPADLLQILGEAVATTESTAWRGPGAATGQMALNKLATYLSNAENQVQIITGKKLLLGGQSGPAPLSVLNDGQWSVQVRVVAIPESSQLSVGDIDELITIPPRNSRTVRMTVHTTGIGTTTLQLQLETKHGSPMPWTAQPLSVEATHYGRALLVLIGAALGVLVLASVARWIRRRRRDGSAEGRSGGSG